LEQKKKSHHYTGPTSITKEEVADLPLFRFKGGVQVISNDHEASKAVDSLKAETVLGFDTESRPSFKKGVSYPVALLQLSTKDKVYIFQLKKLKNLKDIFSVLADPQIIKAGVAIQDDVIGLKKLHFFEDKGFVELTQLTEVVGIINKGLRGLVGLLLKKRISKSIRVSNWAKDVLTDLQINYAATDAWVSRELYLVLKDYVE